MREASPFIARKRWKTLHVRAMAERYARELCGRTGLESRRLVVAAMEWLLLIDPARVMDGAVSGEWLEVQVRMEMRRVRGRVR